jgi:hypothetical protein
MPLKLFAVDPMFKSFNAIDRDYGNIVLIFSEQLVVRFDIDLVQSESLTATGVLNHGFRFVAEMASRTGVDYDMTFSH